MYITKDSDGNYIVSNKELKIMSIPVVDRDIKCISTLDYNEFIKSDDPFKDIVIIPSEIINTDYLKLDIFEIKEI